MTDELKKPQDQVKKARGGWVGVKLDHLESVVDQLPEEDRFLVKRMLRVHENEGGIGDRQMLDHVRKLHARHADLKPTAPKA